MYVIQRLAQAGLCSRRQAIEFVKAGRVTVDAQKVLSPAIKVDDAQELRLDGKAVKTQVFKLWMYNKPRGELVSRSDPRGRRTIFDTLLESPVEGSYYSVPKHVMPVGRLDFASEGLQLLTNDGDFAAYLMNPQSQITRRYHVWARGRLTPEARQQMKEGVTIDGFEYQGILVNKLAGPNSLEVVLFEGKNREVRKVLEHFGMVVGRLRRVQYGPFQLDNLSLGAVKEVPPHKELLQAFEKAMEVKKEEEKLQPRERKASSDANSSNNNNNKNSNKKYNNNNKNSFNKEYNNNNNKNSFNKKTKLEGKAKGSKTQRTSESKWKERRGLHTRWNEQKNGQKWKEAKKNLIKKSSEGKNVERKQERESGRGERAS